MFCISCGHKLEPNSRFCLQCGHPVPISTPDQAPQTPPPSQPQKQTPPNAAPNTAQDPNMDPNAMTPDRIALINYHNQVNSIHTLALVSLIFSFILIGFIMICINAGHINSLPKQVMLYTPEDRALYERTQSKLRSAMVLHFVASAIDLIVTILIAVLFVMMML